MADQRITELTELSKVGVAANDVLAIADISGSETKKVTAKNLIDAGLDLVDVSTIDLNKLDQNSTTKIGTTAIANDAVTYAKIQNVTATNRLLGRSSGGAGVIEEITCTAAGRALLDDASAAAQRTTLGIDTDDSVTFGTVTANLSSTSATITGGTITGITDLAIADGGTGASTAAAARQNLGIEIGVDIQQYDAGLQSISGLTTAADQGIYLTASDTYAVYSLTAAGRALLDDVDVAAQRTTLGLGTLATQSGTFSGTHSGTSSGTNTGDQTITLTGAVTGSGTGSFATTLATAIVGTTNVADDAITYAKIQDVGTTDVLLGRVSVGSGVIEEITCTAAGRALLDDANVTAQRTTLGLGGLAVLSTVDAATITDGSVGTAELADSSVTIGKLSLVAQDLAGSLIANGGITATQLASDAVETIKIIDDAVTYAKIQNVTATDRLLGRSTAGEGVIEEITCTAAGRALLDDADAAAQRTTLGLGALAILDTVDAATITNGSVGTDELANSSVTIGKLSLVAQDLAGSLIANGGITATQLATNAVETLNIADDAVTYAKIQDVTSTDRLLGRSTAGTGIVEEITCTAAGRALLDDADAEAQRTTLGLGALATLGTVDAATITDGSVGTAKLADSSCTTAKVADANVTYAKIQNVSATDKILGRSTAGAGSVEEITCTAAGRALLDDADVAAQRTTLGLGTLATQDGTFSGTHSGTSSGTNTGDQTITLTGAVTGSGTGSFATTLAASIVGTSNIASGAVTYDKIQNTTSTDVILGRSTAGAGTIEEISCTSAGRALLEDANAAEQRTTLGLGDLAVAIGTWTDGSSFSGTSSGTNTGDQTITLTGAVTGSGTGSFATTLATDIVAAANLQASAVTTAKINDSAVDEDKIGDQATCIVSAATPSGTGAFVGQGWINTSTSIKYIWTGAAWTQESGIQTVTVTDSTPLAVAVNNPDAFTANLTLTLDTQVANSVFVGPASGSDAAPTFRALTPADLPDATASTKGIIQPGTGLAVTSGTLNHSNTVTGATKSGITFDAQGHITAAVDLVASDIPNLDAAKITTGAFTSDRIGAGAITATKLANKSTASIGETLPVAAFTGQLHYNPLDKNFFMWDGNVWQSIGISAGAIILAGTYDASTNQVASVTTDGTAIGLSVGAALPSASSTNSNYYLVVSELGTGTAPAPTVSLAPPDLLLSTGSAWLEIDVSSTYTAQTASNIAFSPAASLGSTNVQAALEEVSNECRDVDNMTGGVLDVARGGTNIASYAKGDLIAASASSTLDKLTVGANGYILSANSSTTTGLEWIANQVGTVTEVTASAPLGVTNGTTTPALTISTGTTSAVGVLQLTDGVASSSTTTAATPNGVKTAYDLAALAMPKAGGTFTGEVLIGNTGSLVFEGATDNAFETTLALADPTADQVITLPNSTGTVALTSQLDDGTF